MRSVSRSYSSRLIEGFGLPLPKKGAKTASCYRSRSMFRSNASLRDGAAVDFSIQPPFYEGLILPRLPCSRQEARFGTLPNLPAGHLRDLSRILTDDAR